MGVLDLGSMLFIPNVANILLGVLTVSVALRLASGRKVHPSEPRVIEHAWIPFIGHLIGMALQGGRYIKNLGLSRPGEPIFTLPVPGSRIYVVTDPSLAASIQRNSKTLSFTPLVPDITKRVLGLDKQSIGIIRQNLDPEPGDPRGFLSDVHDLVYGALGPGQYLNTLSCEASQELGDQLAAFHSSLRDEMSVPIDLLHWVRHVVTVGTAKYLFGPMNPIATDPDLEHAFWAFDQGLGGLLIGILPSLTASEAFTGREKCVSAFMQYLDAGYDKGATEIVQRRIRLERDYDLSSEMIARSALSFLFAGIVNTTTTTFWVILRIFADEGLLSTVREEVRDAIRVSEDQHGENHMSLAAIKDHCPTLTAVFRESLRIGSENFSVRLVKEDTLLADKYFLKKGAVVQISGGVIHADKSIWGEDVETFNPERFLGSKAKSGGFHPAAFRGFGGGKTLCPGRHFATNEILVFAAMIVSSFEIKSPNGDRLSVPPKNDRVMPVHILEPSSKERPEAIMVAREEAKALHDLRVVL